MALNTVGRCDGCGGTVKNTATRTGCSTATLLAVHNPTCPGRPTNPTTPKD